MSDYITTIDDLEKVPDEDTRAIKCVYCSRVIPMSGKLQLGLTAYLETKENTPAPFAIEPSKVNVCNLNCFVKSTFGFIMGDVAYRQVRLDNYSDDQIYPDAPLPPLPDPVPTEGPIYTEEEIKKAEEDLANSQKPE